MMGKARGKEECCVAHTWIKKVSSFEWHIHGLGELNGRR